MAIEGPPRELGIQDVLQLLDLTRKTGVLTVRSERLNDEVVIHFVDGRIIAAMHRSSLRRLGQQLLRAGKLTDRELERALEIQREDPSQRMGRILLEMGSVTVAELERQLLFQIEESIYDLMGWDEGHFIFEEAADIEPEISEVAVRVPVSSLLMEGARRIDEWSRLESKIPDAGWVPVLVSVDQTGATPLDLRPGEWEGLAEIDGERDLRQLAADLGLSGFELAKIIYGLIGLGVVHLVERAPALSDIDLAEAKAEAIALYEAGDYVTVAQRLRELQLANPGEADLILMEGRALVAQGRYRAATEAFARAVELDPLSAEAHDQLGIAALRIGDFDRVIEAWNSFLRLSPDPERSESVARGLAAAEILRQLLATGEGERDE
jgi:tetratricopeptide (TPR) repeat protein